MKSDSELMNELAHRTNYLHELTTEESATLKQVLLAIYKDVADICKQYNLVLMLSGGSCLGAVRHKGFIPWDDDLDVMMPRKDYEELISLLKKGVLSEKYEYSTPNPETECENVFLKIYLKGTMDAGLFGINTPFPKGIYIDIFALDGVPDNRVLRWVKGIIASGLQFCTIVTYYAKYQNDIAEKYMSLNPQLKRRYHIKCIIGKILGIIPRKKWLWWFDQWVKDDHENRLMGIPTGRKYYWGEVFNHNVFLPPTESTFEQTSVYIPNGYDAYLKNLYNDYMQLPPVDKRERHFIYEFRLP